MEQNLFFKDPIKTVLIVYRSDGADITHALQQTKKWCDDHQIKSRAVAQSALPENPSPEESADLVVVLGGDGTYLQAVQRVPNPCVPFLGINMGSFGFLTVHRRHSLIQCLNATLQGKMLLEERALIKVSVTDKEGKESHFTALNDMVIERGSFSHLINISVAIQNQDIYSLKADGLIVSSPTGSTAYNLAAGGPILHPRVDSFTITPICSHSLTLRPVIVPDTCEMSFKITNQSAFLTIDGKKITRISHPQIIKVQKSLKKHKTLRQKNHNDFLLLKDKLKFSQ